MTSTETSYPVVLPRHVLLFSQELASYNPTRAELDPTNWADPVAEPSNSGHPAFVGTQTPQRRQRDPDLDPALFESPSKRRRLTLSHLSTSPTARMLLSNSPVTSQTMLPAPVYQTAGTFHRETPHTLPSSPSKMTRTQLETFVRLGQRDLSTVESHILRQEEIIDCAHGTNVAQFLFGRKQVRALHYKEKKRDQANDRHAILFGDGKAQHLTDPELIEGLKNARNARQLELLEVQRKREAREDRAKRKKLCDNEWKEVQETHRLAMEDWAGQCKAMGAVRHKDLPPKPKKMCYKKDLEKKWGLDKPEEQDERAAE
ncbi:hypothetical protein DL96DRAFT_1558058 [Flagelloscypha sp. PMI_526]|nr:hypothetical protein DL96DRAFT_1558058 [Flagelloscypha sp. PMI_526]